MSSTLRVLGAEQEIEPALAVDDVSHSFNRGTPHELRALDGVSLTLEPGAFVVVLGANGSGKSTLLNAVAGVFIPERGSIRIAGEDVTRWPVHRRAVRVGRVFQSPLGGTAPHMSIAENLAIARQRSAGHTFHRTLTAKGRRDIADRVATLDMGLETRLDDRICQLSGGQRQALTLLMATLVRPVLLLLDEHLAALDPRSAELVLRLTQSIVERESLTTVMVTHSVQHAVRLGNRVLVMHRGKVVRDFSDARRARLRVEDLLAVFDQLRSEDQLDASAAAMLERVYV